MKFAITTKSGFSTTIEAPNWADAQKTAIKKFGLGTIVQQISRNSVDKNAICSALPSGCAIVGRPKYYGNSYRGESIVFDVKMPKGKEKECISKMERKRFVVDPDLCYDGGEVVEVEINGSDCHSYINSEVRTGKSRNPIVSNALAYNLARYTSMSGKTKVRAYLENFLHEGKSTRSDDYDLDRLEAFFINIGAKNLFNSSKEKLESGETVQFKIKPELQVVIKPL